MYKTTFFVLLVVTFVFNGTAQKSINKQINRIFTFNDSLNGNFEKFDAVRFRAFIKASEMEKNKAEESILARHKAECLPYRFNSDDYIILPDGSVIDPIYSNSRPFMELIYPEPPCFYVIEKQYYKNGNIKNKGRTFGEYTKIGMWYYFDSTGKLEKQVDEDKKFNKVTYKDIIKLLSLKGLIDPYTGANAEGIKAIFRDSLLLDGNPFWNIQFQSRKDCFTDHSWVLVDPKKKDAWKEAYIKYFGYHLFRIDGITGIVKEGDIIPDPPCGMSDYDLL